MKYTYVSMKSTLELNFYLLQVYYLDRKVSIVQYVSNQCFELNWRDFKVKR